MFKEKKDLRLKRRLQSSLSSKNLGKITVYYIKLDKMESEYKSPKDGKITKIHVSEGSTVDANQVLIEIA